MKKSGVQGMLVRLLAGLIPVKSVRKKLRKRYLNKYPLTILEGAGNWKIKEFGPLNPDKFFFVMWHRSHSGIFSNFQVMLGFMQQIEGLNVMPVVDMHNFRSIYQEPELVNGTDNPWEYYFHQPSPYSLDEVYRSKNVIFCDGVARHWTKEMTPENLPEYTPAIRNFVPIRKEIVEWADQFQQANFTGKKVLAVHFRGQDMKTTRNHPTPATTEQMIEAVSIVEGRNAVDRIFLVTDEEEYLELFKARYGDRLIFTSAFRAKAGVDSFRMQPPPRERHRYLLGLETVRDTLLMSRCDYLIASGKDGLAGGSNVSQVAQILNEGKYKDVYLIHNGFNPSRR